MAGPGEACYRIAAILFTLDANVHAKKSMSCTSLPCSWLPPSFRTAPFAPISDKEFSAPDRICEMPCSSRQNVTVDSSSIKWK